MSQYVRGRADNTNNQTKTQPSKTTIERIREKGKEIPGSKSAAQSALLPGELVSPKECWMYCCSKQNSRTTTRTLS